MAQQLLEYRVVVDSSTGIASIQALDKAIKQTDVSTKQLSQSTEKVSKNLGQAANKSGLAGAAVVEIGRTISDANYGMMAMANNLQQVATLMITLVATSGGLKKGLGLLLNAFKGPLGLIVVFQTFIALIERADKKQRELKDSSNGIAEAYGKAAADLRIFVDLMGRSTTKIYEKERMVKSLNEKYEDLNVQMDENGVLTRQSSIDIAFEIQMLQLKAEAQAMVTEITKLYGEEAKALAASNAEFVGFYEYLTAKIKGGDITESISQAIDMLASFGSSVPYTLQDKDIGLLSDTAQTERENKIDNIKKRVEGLIGRLPPDVYEVLFGEKKKGGKKETDDKKDVEGIFGIPPQQELVKTFDYYVDQYKIFLDALRKTTVERLVEGEDGKVTSIFESLFKTPEELLSSTPEWEKAKMELLKIPKEEYLKDFELGVDEFLNSALARDAALFQQEELAASARGKLREEEKEHALLMYDAIGGGLQALSDIAGKETAAGKAFAVAGALIDTYAAIAGQLRAAQKSAGAAIPGYAIAQAIATGLFGFAQVKKILSVQVPGGGGGGGSAGSMAPAPSPTFNVVGSSGSSQLREAVERGMEKPVKAYVTQKDINSSAELDRNTRKSATIV